MRKILLTLLLSFPLFAGFFPSSVQTSIQSVNGKTSTLSKPFPINGMTGVVIHNYGKGLNAITSRISQTSSNGQTQLLSVGVIQHEALPTINTSVQAGDKVIGGYLYHNVLLLAPDADTYARVTKSYHKKWIHPDLFALYIAREGEGRASKENLAKFAKKFQIGLVYIVDKNSERLVDPISGKTIAKKARVGTISKGMFPFYMRLGTLETGWFGGSETGEYYQAMGAL